MPTQPAILGSARLGNVRLGYVPAALSAVRQTKSRIVIDGVAARVRRGSVTIADILNETPNSCALTVDGIVAPVREPVTSQALRITINSDVPRLLFAGTLQTHDRAYEKRPVNLVYPCSGIDFTARLNRRRPIGAYVNQSATAIAEDLTTRFAPGFTTTHIEAGLPALTINFDGSTTFINCLVQLANEIGGYCKVDDTDVYLFLDDTDDAPDPIDVSHPPLDDPPIKWSSDDSQLVTRLYGKGHAEPLLSDVLAGETILPVPNTVMFNPAGGQAIAAVTAEGAATQILNYTGTQIGGGGSLVGPGASPSSAPGTSVVSGSGVDSGDHDYAVVYVTAAGKSLPGPRVRVTTGLIPPPSVAPIAGTPTFGGSVDVGSHTYLTTFVNAAGETSYGAESNAVTAIAGVSDPGAIGAATSAADTNSDMGSVVGVLQYAYTFRRLSDGAETNLSPVASYGFIGTSWAGAYLYFSLAAVSTPPSGYVRQWYRTAGNGSTFKRIPVGTQIGSTGVLSGTEKTDSGWNHFVEHSADGALGAVAPSANHTNYGTVPLSNIQIGPTSTTERNIYRRFNSTGTFKFAFTIGNNTATEAIDTLANASLGADAPTTNTATASQVALPSVPIGPPGVTSREIYRTPINSSQLKLQQTIADNTTSSGVTDATADASLGANAPTGDTSGLTQPNGQVAAGSTSLIMAGTGAMPSAGWAIIGNGQQVIRYTGTTGGSLTGIPASGPGAIVASIGYNSTVTAAPVLTGVSGVLVPLGRGASVHVWVQRDDLAAQAAAAERESTDEYISDGIHEHTISDGRRGEASLMALCDAHLARLSWPIVTVVYATRDVKTRSGKPAVFNLPSLPIVETLTIQEVRIDEIDLAPGLAPRYIATASTVRFSLEAMLRKMGAADAH